jgi:hypothetical protein
MAPIPAIEELNFNPLGNQPPSSSLPPPSPGSAPAPGAPGAGSSWRLASSTFRYQPTTTTTTTTAHLCTKFLAITATLSLLSFAIYIFSLIIRNQLNNKIKNKPTNNRINSSKKHGSKFVLVPQDGYDISRTLMAIMGSSSPLTGLPVALKNNDDDDDSLLSSSSFGASKKYTIGDSSDSNETSLPPPPPSKESSSSELENFSSSCSHLNVVPPNLRKLKRFHSYPV